MSDPNTTPWTETLPQDVREWDEVKNSDSPEKFWDQMVNMRSRMGSSIRIPSTDASEEDRKAFYQRLQEKVPGLMPTPDFDKGEGLDDLYARMGRPKEAKEYKAPELVNSKGEKLEGAGKEFIESFKEVAFNAGLSQKKFEEVVSAIMSRSIQADEQARQLHQADMEELSKTWGAAYERNAATVSNFLSQTDAPKAVIDAIKSNSADSATMVWLHNLATKTVGKQGTFQADANQNSTMSPDEAAVRISEIRNNPKHPYNNKFDPGHESAKKFMRELYLLKNPTTGKAAAPGTVFNIGGDVQP